jgi:hypothetical protein
LDFFLTKSNKNCQNSRTENPEQTNQLTTFYWLAIASAKEVIISKKFVVAVAFLQP